MRSRGLDQGVNMARHAVDESSEGTVAEVDGLRFFLASLSRRPLLTPAEEKHLGSPST